MYGCDSAEQSCQEQHDGQEQELDSDAVQLIPAAAILEPGGVGLVGSHSGDAIVDRHKHRHTKDDAGHPKDGGG